LVAERLAAAGRHHDDRVFAFEDRADHFALAFAKVFEAEVLASEATASVSECMRASL
jgi:hypothetical protein